MVGLLIEVGIGWWSSMPGPVLQLDEVLSCSITAVSSGCTEVPLDGNDDGIDPVVGRGTDMPRGEPELEVRQDDMRSLMSISNAVVLESDGLVVSGGELGADPGDRDPSKLGMSALLGFAFAYASKSKNASRSLPPLTLSY